MVKRSTVRFGWYKNIKSHQKRMSCWSFRRIQGVIDSGNSQIRVTVQLELGYWEHLVKGARLVLYEGSTNVTQNVFQPYTPWKQNKTGNYGNNIHSKLKSTILLYVFKDTKMKLFS